MRSRPRRAGLALLVAVAALAATQLPVARSQSPATTVPDTADVAGWAATGSARLTADAGALVVTASAATAPGALAAARAASPGRQVVTVAVRAVQTTGARTVRVVVRDADGRGADSAPVTLQPWWQTATVSLPDGTPDLRAGVVGIGSWTTGDSFAMRDVRVATVDGTVSSTSGRLLLVDGRPYTMKGAVYFTAPIGGTPWTTPWHTDPAQCQADAQLLRAAGMNTIRVYFVPELWEPTTGNQCLDAMYGAGVRVIWLLQPPGGTPWHVDSPVYVEAFWTTVRLGIEAVRHHPATLAYNIGNEIEFREKDSSGWFPQLNELARRAKQLDPAHVVTSTVSANQFLDPHFGGPVSPTLAPEVDMWGINLFAEKGAGYRNFMPALKSLDNTRPMWLSEFGVDRFECVQPKLYGLTCGPGSSEKPAMQAQWDAWNWREIAANLTTVDPRAGLVGATVVMWSDIWWFAMGFNGNGTPATREISGLANGWTQSSFPDGHESAEFWGINHAQARGATGPRVTTQTYDALAALFTGKAGLGLAGPKVRFDGCDAVVDFMTSAPAYGRVDWGPVNRVIVGGDNVGDSFYADRSLQGSIAAIAHRFDLGSLLPGSLVEIHVRGFAPDGRPVSAAPVRVTIPAGC